MGLFNIFSSKEGDTSAPKVSAADSASKIAELEKKLALYESAFTEIENLSVAVAKGDLRKRITNWDEFGPVTEVLCNLNQVIDLVDAYVREAGASLKAAGEKRYYRKFLTTGMLGDFGQGAAVINATSESIEAIELEQAAKMQQMATDFEGHVMEIIASIGAAAVQNSTLADVLINNADETQSMSTTVAAAAEQATVNVEMVAAAAEELSSSVEEINRQVTTSSQKTSDAKNGADSASHTIQQLSEASDKIGEVVKLISDIAEQTNLLALNATIEAARAGEAGKGFAVVASEVKSLANQTSEATSDIGQQISNIQQRTDSSVEAVNGISQLIIAINEIAGMIAAATEQQSSATVEISRNIQEASEGTRNVSQTISGVSMNAKQTLESAREMIEGADQMSRQIARLEQQSKAFLEQIRR